MTTPDRPSSCASCAGGDAPEAFENASPDCQDAGHSRRDFLRAAAGAGLAAGTGLLGLAGCQDDTSMESFLQAHFLQLQGADLEAVIKRVEAEYKEKYHTDITVGVEPALPGVLFGYGLDLSRCVGCRACAHACAMENNCSRGSGERDQNVHWIRVLEMEKERGVDLTESQSYYLGPKPGGGLMENPKRDGDGLSRKLGDYQLNEEQRAMLQNLVLGDPGLDKAPRSGKWQDQRDWHQQYPLYRKSIVTKPAAQDDEQDDETTAVATPPSPFGVPRDGKFYMPVACQQCRRPPCVKVCPVKATWQEPDGIVVVDYNWCIGCRYCMAACPYGARHFNWGEPTLPEGEINTDTHYLGNRPRYRGHVEKCTFCIQRTRNGRYPACVEICPVGARKFGDLNDPNSEVRYIMRHKRVFILKSELNTAPKFFYFYAQ